VEQTIVDVRLGAGGAGDWLPDENIRTVERRGMGMLVFAIGIVTGYLMALVIEIIKRMFWGD
jgi:hypothetical protein